MRILLIALFTTCLTLTGINSTYAASSSNQTSASAQLSDKWEQVKTAASSHAQQLTNRVTSNGFWSQVGTEIKSYWQKTVTTVKGWVSSSNS